MLLNIKIDTTANRIPGPLLLSRHDSDPYPDKRFMTIYTHILDKLYIGFLKYFSKSFPIIGLVICYAIF